MRSTFYGLEIARKGLHVNQANLEVTAHNIANANTKGYSRQQVIQKAIEPGMGLGLFTTYGGYAVGGGVDIQQVRQIRDAYLDMQYRKESTALGEWEVKRDMLAYIEAIFNEPSESGINTVLNEFFNALQALSLNPEDPTTRATVQQKALALTENIRNVYTKLEELQREANQAIISHVEDINSYAREIAALNEQIFKFESTGRPANDLRDQRNLILDNLSKIVQVSVYEDASGRFRVDIAGQTLVNHTKVYELATIPRSSSVNGMPYPKNNHVDVDELVEVVWKDTGERVNITGGILKGFIDMRDGIGGKEQPLPGVPDELLERGASSGQTGTSSADTQFQPAPNQNAEYGIPYYMRMWNLFAHTLMITFNEIHSQGYTLNGETGIYFFSDGSADFDPANARQPIAKYITISDDIREDWNNIAAIYFDEEDKANGMDPQKGFNPAEAKGNNKNILRLLDLRHKTYVPECNNMDNFTKALISTLGVASRQAAHMADNQEMLVAEMDKRRQSVSGVSLDEEMANMVRFQHAYNASARILTAIDEMLETLINRMGVVGR
ncbi:MAG: flagellar hook-associated protein FlgK [Caldicoprobacter oshimai]|uniref:Flagellar hook-associated protein 1 n=1 Tax=Caldicoprobacter faecalis TaxID=937334 RepID=A0A1I5V5X1_9FIRM|nr:flagellar hook-associated protein FlgK [Caldicoprobacter faecalis]PZN11265.1 MAG: flagellar hook-associated protein FlgK [Caldicoprobacter oshimai]SFQ02888.1 flagellar hook-associated protein 1 FlgK [Caldicoprobacter faecalis]